MLANSRLVGTVKLSRICPFCGRILLDKRLIINDLAVAAGGENAAKLLNLTVPAVVRLGHGDGFDMHHERRGTGRAAQQHRPADRDGPGARPPT